MLNDCNPFIEIKDDTVLYRFEDRRGQMNRRLNLEMKFLLSLLLPGEGEIAT